MAGVEHEIADRVGFAAFDARTQVCFLMGLAHEVTIRMRLALLPEGDMTVLPGLNQVMGRVSLEAREIIRTGAAADGRALFEEIHHISSAHGLDDSLDECLLVAFPVSWSRGGGAVWHRQQG